MQASGRCGSGGQRRHLGPTLKFQWQLHFMRTHHVCSHEVSLPLKLESLTVHCLLHGQVHRPPPMQEACSEPSMPCSSECLVALFELCLVVERVHRCIVAERLLFVLLLTQSSNQCKHVQTMGSHSYLSGFCATILCNDLNMFALS
jgi:hypothetical protein